MFSELNDSSPAAPVAEPVEPKAVRRMAWGLAPLCVLTVYVLSAGPIAMLIRVGKLENTPMVKNLVEVAYAPVIWAAKKPTPLRTPLRLYFRLWGLNT